MRCQSWLADKTQNGYLFFFNLHTHKVWEKTYAVCLIFVNSGEDSSHFLNSGAFDCSVML